MQKLEFTYDNVYDFYKAAETASQYGNQYKVDEYKNRERPTFKGLTLEEIDKSKYCYKKGLEQLKEINLNVDLGGSKLLFKFNEFDGDDMDYDRMLNGFSPMRKRIRTFGIGSGRMINIYVVISENCEVRPENMIIKAITAMQIIDTLESQGYRVAVYACDYIQDGRGTYKGEKGVMYTLKVCLKKHEDSLNKGLILTGISPWFFRHYMFMHQSGHYTAGETLGSSTQCTEPQTKENIIINHGECLTEKSATEKIKEIEKLFSN